VVGIELDEDSAKEAKTICDDIIIADAETLENIPYPEEFFDVIVFAGVLQFFKRPDNVLRKFAKYLRKDGVVIASIPNICEWRLRVKILFGRFRYNEVGILEKGHLRFFTLATAKELFESTGYQILGIDYDGLAHLPIFRAWPSLFASEFIFRTARNKGC